MTSAILHKPARPGDPLGPCADDCGVCAGLPMSRRSTREARARQRARAALPYLRRAIAARVAQWDAERAIERIYDREIDFADEIATLAVGYDRARDVTVAHVREVVHE